LAGGDPHVAIAAMARTNASSSVVFPMPCFTADEDNLPHTRAHFSSHACMHDSARSRPTMAAAVAGRSDAARDNTPERSPSADAVPAPTRPMKR
jgi:hypothetical protein